MSAIATTNPLHRTIGFYQASIGKKVVMAVTGVILFGYVLGHMLGNLQILPERHVTEALNLYCAFLHSHGASSGRSAAAAGRRGDAHRGLRTTLDAETLSSPRQLRE